MNHTNSMTGIYRYEFLLFTILISIVLVVFASCGNKDGESALEKTKRQLIGEWQLTSLVVDGTDQTNLFPKLIITVANGTYQAVNGEPIWPASGTWSLTDDATIERDNNLTIHIESMTETTMTLSLVWSKGTFGNGRQNSVSGKNTFQFTKK